MERQTHLETEARDRGVERQRSAVARALARGRATDTIAGVDMLKRSLEPAALAIAEYMVEVEAREAGRKPPLFRLCGACDPYLLAYITGKVAIDRAAHDTPLLRTSLSIGSAVEDEFRLAAFEEREPHLYATIARSLRDRSASPDHARVVWSTSAAKAGIELPRWSRNELVQVGVTLFDLFATSTGLIERVLLPHGRGKVQWRVRLAGQASEWFSHRNDNAGLLRPAYLPTVVQPQPWSSLRGGGYHTDNLFALPFIKRTRPDHMQELKTADLRHVYAGMNAIQNTGWRVNTQVLDVMQRAWDSGVQFPCLPNRDDLTVPEKPFDIETNTQARREWRHRAREVHTLNVQSRGTRFELARLLTTATELRHDPVIYFPHQLDFRGRAYAVPATLNPQGPDEARGLLTFAEAKPLWGAGKGAVSWLFIHGANVFGYDKASLSDRAIWGEQHRARAVATAADPFADLWWTEADKPWSFLAWCFEVARTDGLSSLPIALDGSCNGLQHFSAMLRDPIGGAATNLVPSSTPADIYQRVADRVIEKMQALRSDPAHMLYATGWLAFGIDRKITKRPVMVLPYGGTRMAAIHYIRDEVRTRIRAGQENPFGDQLPRAEVWLSGLVWQAIGEVVVAARAAMDWLQQVARVAASANQALTWTAPSGFIAHQSYLDVTQRRIRTRSRGEFLKLTDYTETQRLDRVRQANGISPNFVHSMDAAVMMLTIEQAVAAGVSQFAMIHDSYGTVAADTDTLAHTLRRAFVDMYENHDVLAEFAASVSARLPDKERLLLPSLPSKGNLDLQSVLTSDYFFA
jgi:DNA-directed RNA polymerase